MVDLRARTCRWHNHMMVALAWLQVEQEGPEPLAVAIVGRPNVGKSSILNALVGKERSIVSSVSGTTRDAIDTEITTTDGQRFTLIDTAGRRRADLKTPAHHFYGFALIDSKLLHLGRPVCCGSVSLQPLSMGTGRGSSSLLMSRPGCCGAASVGTLETTQGLASGALRGLWAHRSSGAPTCCRDPQAGGSGSLHRWCRDPVGEQGPGCHPSSGRGGPGGGCPRVHHHRPLRGHPAGLQAG